MIVAAIIFLDLVDSSTDVAKATNGEETVKNILLVTSSPNGSSSQSTKFAAKLAASLGIVTERDLYASPLPPIDLDFIQATRGGSVEAAADAVAHSDALIEEIQANDVIVVAAGFINFGIPANLKTYIDYIARPRKTFAYDANGPQGLIKGKKVVLVLSYGGVYSSGPAQSMDFMEPYLRTVFGFLGVEDIETIRIEGVAFGVDAAVERAEESAKQLVGSAA